MNLLLAQGQSLYALYQYNWDRVVEYYLQIGRSWVLVNKSYFINYKSGKGGVPIQRPDI